MDDKLSSQPSASMSESSPDSSRSQEVVGEEVAGQWMPPVPDNGNDDPSSTALLSDAPTSDRNSSGGSLQTPNATKHPGTPNSPAATTWYQVIKSAQQKSSPPRDIPSTKGKGKRSAESEGDEEDGGDERRRSGSRQKRSEDAEDGQRDDEETESERPLTPRTAGAQSAGAIGIIKGKMEVSPLPAGDQLSQLFKNTVDGEESKSKTVARKKPASSSPEKSPKKKKYLPLPDVIPYEKTPTDLDHTLKVNQLDMSNPIESQTDVVEYRGPSAERERELDEDHEELEKNQPDSPTSVEGSEDGEMVETKKMRRKNW